MDAIHGLLYGLGRATEPRMLLLGFLGCLWGTMVGVLPGIGPVAGITILIPFTYGMDLAPAMVMMAGIYYGAMYGGFPSRGTTRVRRRTEADKREASGRTHA